jgi:hypothetical protein
MSDRICFNDTFSDIPAGCTFLTGVVDRCLVYNPGEYNVTAVILPNTGINIINNSGTTNPFEIKYVFKESFLSCCPISNFTFSTGNSVIDGSNLTTSITFDGGVVAMSGPLNLSSLQSYDLTPFSFGQTGSTFAPINEISFFISGIPNSEIVTVSNIRAVCGSNPRPPVDTNVQVIQPYGCNNGRISVKNFSGTVSLTPPTGRPISNTTGIFYVVNPGIYFLTYTIIETGATITDTLHIKSGLMC